jgi:general secretion pathway protein D
MTKKLALTLLVALLTAATQAADTGLKESVQHKLERIVIPKLEFRDAPLREVAEFLRKKSIELDVDSPAAQRGVNFFFPIPAAPVANPADARVTVSLTDVPLIEVLRTITKAANCKFKVQPYAVGILPASAILTREWKLARS